MEYGSHADTDSMKEIFKLSIEEVKQVLNGARSITDVTKIAAITISNYTRLKSAEIHDKAIEVMLARKNTVSLPT